MKWGRRKPQNPSSSSSTSSSSSSSRPSFMSNIFPASWLSKLKQKKSSQEATPRKVKGTEKGNSPCIQSPGYGNGTSSPGQANGNPNRLCSGYNGEFWKLSFGEDDIDVKSGVISRSVWYKSEDEHELPRTSHRSCRSKCTEFEGKEEIQNLEDMVSRMTRRRRRRKEAPTQVNILRRESDIESRTPRIKYRENGNFKSMGQRVMDKKGFKREREIDKARERTRRSVGKKMLVQEEESGVRKNRRDKTKLRSSRKHRYVPSTMSKSSNLGTIEENCVFSSMKAEESDEHETVGTEIDSDWERMRELKMEELKLRYERQRQSLYIRKDSNEKNPKGRRKLRVYLAFASLFSAMLLFFRSLFHVSRRASYRVISLSFNSSHPGCLSFDVFNGPSSLTSINGYYISCPFFWFSSFLCIFRLPFVSYSITNDSFELLDIGSLRKIIQQDLWNDPKIVVLFDSALAPIWVSKILVELKEDPKLALKFFKWAGTHFGFRHTTESYCIIVHMLFRARMYTNAHDIMKEMVLKSRTDLILPVCNVFDILWSTRNFCVSGTGVFDVLFSVLVELGLLEEANECFSKMRKFRTLPKARSCNFLLHRLSKSGNGQLVRKFFDDMIGAGIAPSVFTYNVMIDHLCKEGDLENARSLFVQMRTMGFSPDVVTYNSLIDGYGKVGLLKESVYLFNELKDVGCVPDVITYNALINCFCKFEKMPQAFEYLSEMKNNGLKPNVVTYSTLIDAFCKEGMMQGAIKLFVDMRRVGLLPNEFTYTSLIDANCKAGNLTEAWKLSNDMLQAGVNLNIVTYTALMDGLCEDGRMMEAEEVFRAMLKDGISPNQQVYTALVHGYIKAEKMEDALEILKQMTECGIKPDLVLYGTIIWGLCNQNKLEETKLIIKEMKIRGIRSNPVIYTTIIDAYFKAGKSSDALDLLQEMQEVGVEATVVTYCVLIDGLCKTGMVEVAVDYFGRMSDFGVQPNVAVYTALIDGLCKINCIESAKKLFDEMQCRGMTPDKTAFTALIDGNLKLGNLQEALNLISKMTELVIEFDLHAYTTLVSGFSQCGELHQARKFFNEMIEKGILPDEILCICLLREYNKLGHLDEAIELKNEMQRRGLITEKCSHEVPSLKT